MDWDLYRALFSPSANPLWGRFPHPPIGQLAARLGVSPNSVWRKLTEWRKTGFLRGYIVLPHPALLGVGLSGFCLKVSGPAEKRRLLTDLELVDGVIFSSYEVGPRVDVVVVADREEAQERRKKLIARLPGVTFVGATRELWLPRCEGFLSANDWSLITALRTSPEDSLLELADRTGLSVRTVTRRLARMQLSHTVLSHFLEDWTRFPGTVVVFQLGLRPGTDSLKVGPRFQEEVPSAVEIPWQFHPPGTPVNPVAYLAPVRTGPAIDDVVEVALGIPGVAKVETAFPGSEQGYPGWLDEHIGLLRHHTT